MYYTQFLFKKQEILLKTVFYLSCDSLTIVAHPSVKLLNTFTHILFAWKLLLQLLEVFLSYLINSVLLKMVKYEPQVSTGDSWFICPPQKLWAKV